MSLLAPSLHQGNHYGMIDLHFLNARCYRVRQKPRTATHVRPTFNPLCGSNVESSTLPDRYPPITRSIDAGVVELKPLENGGRGTKYAIDRILSIDISMMNTNVNIS